MNGSPLASTSRPPAPRTASVIRKFGALSWWKVVGWNCTNSILISRAPACEAIANPSPRAPAGLLVRRKICPNPPVARIVLRAMQRLTSPVACSYR